MSRLGEENQQVIRQEIQNITPENQNQVYGTVC